MANPLKQSVYDELGDVSRKRIDEMSTQERWQKLAQLLAIELRRQINEPNNEDKEKETQNEHPINRV